MDQKKVGSFIKELRIKNNLTQEELGEKLFVTNKTVSRWENGNYMPDLDTFKELSELFNVKIEELLLGCYEKEEMYKEDKVEEVKKQISDVKFSRKEHEKYWKKKYRKDHIFDYVIGLILLISFYFLFPVIFEVSKSSMPTLSLFFSVAEFGYFNNRMMIYVESKLY